MTGAPGRQRADLPGAFAAEITDAGGGIVLRLAGELDIAVQEKMSAALSAGSSAAVDQLVIDASGLTFMSACGLSLLVAAHNRRIEEGLPGLVVMGAAGIVRRIFEVTQLTYLLGDRPPASPGTGLEPPEEVSSPQLEAARCFARLSVRELYVDYFALGGTADLAGVVAHLGGGSRRLDLHEQDVLVHALNERLADVGDGRLLAYASDGS